MQLRALVIILVAGSIFGLLLYLPFFLWFRWRRKVGRPAAPGRYGKPVPRGELKWMVLIIVLLLVGYAQGHLAPATWFGAQMRTDAGRTAFALVLAVVLSVIRVAWLAWRAHVRRSRTRSNWPDDSDA
jgi:hypothetical protein